MRNIGMKFRMQKKERKIKKSSAFGACVAVLAALCGCGDNHSQGPVAPVGPPASLISANQALTSHSSDLAIANAQDYLRTQPGGPYAADAYYIQGGAYEEKTAGSPEEAQRNLFESRNCFIEALDHNPSPALEGNIRASLSNVAFFQDDFATSIQEATMAMKLVSDNNIKGSLLFKIGSAQQRLGRFTDADQTFRQVEQRYPNTAVAKAASEHEGMKDFYVQVATFSNIAAAEQAVAALRGNGITVTQRTDNKGLTVLDNGPFSQYGEAKKLKDQLQKNFPQAMIVP